MGVGKPLPPSPLANEANGDLGAYVEHNENCTDVQIVYKLQTDEITSPGQVRAGRVRNAKLGVEKLIEEHLPSTLSEFILFETVL